MRYRTSAASTLDASWRYSCSTCSSACPCDCIISKIMRSHVLAPRGDSIIRWLLGQPHHEHPDARTSKAKLGRPFATTQLVRVDFILPSRCELCTGSSPSSPSQVGKGGWPYDDELEWMIMAGRGFIHTAKDSHERQRPRDIRGIGRLRPLALVQRRSWAPNRRRSLISSHSMLTKPPDTARGSAAQNRSGSDGIRVGVWGCQPQPPLAAVPGPSRPIPITQSKNPGPEQGSTPGVINPRHSRGT